MSSIITDAARAACTGTDRGVQDVLDFLVTHELSSTAFLTAAIERVGAQPFTAGFWLPGAAFDNGGVGLFSTAEIVESVGISLYLIGVGAYARAGEDVAPNDVGFEPFGWPTVAAARDALEGLGIGYGTRGGGAGRFYEYPADPIARGVGTPVTRVDPR